MGKLTKEERIRGVNVEIAHLKNIIKMEKRDLEDETKRIKKRIVGYEKSLKKAQELKKSIK